MIENLKECKICPHECKVNRLLGKKGKCKCDDKLKIALISTHNYEEPCISGINGSGTIFFSNCNLKCAYCQNYVISQEGKGNNYTIKELAKKMIEQQAKGVHNINLVTPTAYIYQIIEAIDIAKEQGLNIPIIYNTNAYEKIETLKLLKGYIDIYLPDLKYYYNELAKKYSKVENYFQIATKAICEMYNQVGSPILNQDGIIQKGLMIRHLVLPNYTQNSKKILQWIKNNIDKNVYVSIMAQYFPEYLAKQDDKINRKLTTKEYRIIENFVYQLELENGYMQELGKNEKEYVPHF